MNWRFKLRFWLSMPAALALSGVLSYHAHRLLGDPLAFFVTLPLCLLLGYAAGRLMLLGWPPK